MLCFFKYALLFLSGGVAYGMIELLFRGHTHWTMAIAGGICLIVFYHINHIPCVPWIKYLLGGGVITAVEGIFGIVFNIILDWNIWDYSNQWLNAGGQICVMFSAFWVLLSIPAFGLCHLLDSEIFCKLGR